MNKVRGFLDTPEAKRKEVDRTNMPAYKLQRAYETIDQLGNANLYLIAVAVLEFFVIMGLSVALLR